MAGTVGQPSIHKEAAKDFLRMAAAGQVREAYRAYVSADCRHHNPYFRGDVESLMLAMEESAAKHPNKVLEIHRVIGDGDLVAVHSHVVLSPEDSKGMALVHIFRFEGEKIIELWDIGQALPEIIPNEHGMF